MYIATNIAWEFWRTICEMAPYLLFGFLVAGVLSVVVSPRLVERHLGGDGILPVFKAALFGVPLPLCSCGVIPVAASLRRHGASSGATTAFLLSTPQTGVDSIMVTFSLLGPLFAVFRPVAALLTGMMGGWIVSLLGGAANERQGANTTVAEGDQPTSSTSVAIRALRYGLFDLPSDIGKPMLAGLIAAGAISVLVPPDFFSRAIGTGLWAMVVMMIVGIPIYVCATASVPIAAAMIAKGVSPGAAFVFLMTGPATNAAAIATLWKILGKRAALVYLVTLAVAALASGAALDYVFAVARVAPGHATHWMLPQSVKTISAVVLLAALGIPILKGAKRRRNDAVLSDGERVTRFKIEGMTCSHCVETVRRTLAACSGVRVADVSLAEGNAMVAGKDYDVDSILAAVGNLGYKISVDERQEARIV